MNFEVSYFPTERRAKTEPDSRERELQIIQAKKEAAKYMYMADLRKCDQATFAYLHRNGGTDKLSRFYTNKLNDVVLLTGSDKAKLEEVVLTDLKVNGIKDSIGSMADYRKYRRKLFTMIKKDADLLIRLANYDFENMKEAEPEYDFKPIVRKTT